MVAISSYQIRNCQAYGNVMCPISTQAQLSGLINFYIY